MFKEGMEVTVRIHGAGVVSEEDHIIGKVDGDKVWLDDDEDMNEDTAFVNGRKSGFFGFWLELIPKK